MCFRPIEMPFLCSSMKRNTSLDCASNNMWQLRRGKRPQLEIRQRERKTTTQTKTNKEQEI
jgi:hypothetical protein